MSRREKKDRELDGKLISQIPNKLTLFTLSTCFFLILIIFYEKKCHKNDNQIKNETLSNYGINAEVIINKYKAFIDCIDKEMVNKYSQLNDTTTSEALNIKAFLEYKRNTADVFYNSIVGYNDTIYINEEIKKSKLDLERRAQIDNLVLNNICNQ